MTRGGGCFVLVDFESFLFYYFEVFKFFFLSFCGSSKNLCFLFLYFEVPESLIFFLSFWGSSNLFV